MWHEFEQLNRYIDNIGECIYNTNNVYNVDMSINGMTITGIFDTYEDAIKYRDEQINKYRHQRIAIIDTIE